MHLALRVGMVVRSRTAKSLATVLETELIKGNGRVPLAAVADHGVEDGEELPHAGDLGDLGRFAVGPKTVIEGPDNGVPLGRTPDAEKEG